jgi:ubiquinone/menaquinone biosynthesis C-methylase UbiE
MEPTEHSDRQRRELEYHRKHAIRVESRLLDPFSFDVINQPPNRWWNAYWRMFAFLKTQNIAGKRVLVVGCGSGEDVLRIAKMGADVYGFDLSEEMLAIANGLAKREGLKVTLDIMPAEMLSYSDNFFDIIVARDILHHVEIPSSIAQLERVSKPNALWLLNEIYSHTWTDKVRQSAFVTKVLYPRMKGLVYGEEKPYITEDERKMTELDIAMATRPIQQKIFQAYFYFLLTRIIPERWHAIFAKIDRGLMKLLSPVGGLLAGRIIVAGRVKTK